MYSKVFQQIFDSSISDDYVVRHVFMDLLVLADKHGEIDMTMAAIARRTNVPDEIVRHAIDQLTAPDPDSRTADEEGRRLVLLDDHRAWGWRIVNFVQYNAMRNEDARREYFREYKSKYRAKKNNDLEENVQDKSGQSTPVHHESTKSTPTDSHSPTPSKVSKPSASHPAIAGPGTPEGKHPDLLIYEAYPRREGRAAALVSIGKAVKRLTGGEGGGGLTDALAARRWLWQTATAYAKSPAGMNEDRTKVPHPATWFNQSRYLDDQTNWQHTGDNHGKRDATAGRGGRTIDAAQAAIEAIENRRPPVEDGDSPPRK